MNVQNLIRSSGVRNFAKLLSANVVAQVIGLVVYPILTRIYTPEDFGLLNLFLSIGGVLVILSTAEYYYAIVLPKEDKEAVGVLGVCLTILTIVTSLTILSVFFSDQIAYLFKTPKLVAYYWMMPILVFVLGAWNILNYWYIRDKKFDRISGYQLSQSLLSASTKIGFGIAGFLHGGMIMATVIAPFVSLVISVIISFRKKMNSLFCVPSDYMWRMAKKYRNFPIYSLPRSLVNMVAGQLPVLLLTPVFGSKEVGFWSMALMLGFIPVSVITKSLYQVLYQYVTDKVNNHQSVGKYMRNFTIYVIAIGVPVFIVLYWMLPALTECFLGGGWESTGLYIRWMLPWLLCSFLTSSTGFLSDVFSQQKVAFVFEVLTAVCRTIGVVTGLILKDFSVSVAGYALGSALAVLAQYVWLMTLVKKYDYQING